MENLTGKTIAILTEDGFEEIELTSPKEALEKAGAKTEIISPKNDHVRAKKGAEWSGEYKVDVQLSHASPSHYDGLLIPGGVINPDKLRTDRHVLGFIRSSFDEEKP